MLIALSCVNLPKCIMFMFRIQTCELYRFLAQTDFMAKNVSFDIQLWYILNLFITTLEILANKIRNDTNINRIKGININNKDIKISLLADDITLTLLDLDSVTKMADGQIESSEKLVSENYSSSSNQ